MRGSKVTTPDNTRQALSNLMTKPGTPADKGKAPQSKTKKKGSKKVAKPDWADGLKQFYDAVVDEPLPDEMTRLLSQFDDSDGDGG